MTSIAILIGLAGILASAAPVIFATIGETITERGGVINLSVNGTIILTAMVGFAAAVSTNNTLVGFIAGMVVSRSARTSSRRCKTMKDSES